MSIQLRMQEEYTKLLIEGLSPIGFILGPKEFLELKEELCIQMSHQTFYDTGSLAGPVTFQGLPILISSISGISLQLSLNEYLRKIE